MKRAIVAIAVLGLGIAGCRGGGTPEQAVEDMFRAAESGNCNGFQEYFSQQVRSVAGPKLDQMCQEAAKQAKDDSKRLRTMHVLEKTEEGDRATLRIQPELNDGTKEDAEQIRLVKEDGRWRIEPVK